MSHSLALTRRDARRDAPEVDYSKLLLVLAAIGAGVAVWYKFGRTAQAAPTPSPGIPGSPGPGNQMGPSQPAGGSLLPPTPNPNGPAAASQGDLITVDPGVAVALVPGLPSPPTAPVQFVVTGASPGTPVVLAQTTGQPVGVPPGIIVPVPRSAITTVQKGGGAPPIVPTPPGGNPTPLAVTDLGDPLTVKQGHHYRARVQLSALEQMLANPQAIASQFSSAGFSDVQVFRGNADPLPSDWPITTISVPPIDGGTWFVMGTWQNPDANVPRPPQVVRVWEQ